MLSTIAALVLAASLFTPQPTQLIVSPNTGAPTLELGVLSAPLQGELIPAVRADFARGDEVSAHVFPYDPI